MPTGNGFRIVLAASRQEAEGLPGELRLGSLDAAKPQSCALRKQVSAGRTTYAVLGADAAGAMDGGLDLAEAIRLAQALQEHARMTLQLCEAMPQTVTNKELRLTLGDLRAVAHLGDYYAEKILAATDLALFDRTGGVGQQAVATRQYRPQLLTRIGELDLNRLTQNVAADIALAREWKPGTLRPPSPPTRRPASVQPGAGSATR